jgi:hypothetical protein
MRLTFVKVKVANPADVGKGKYLELMVDSGAVY